MEINNLMQNVELYDFSSKCYLQVFEMSIEL